MKLLLLAQRPRCKDHHFTVQISQHTPMAYLIRMKSGSVSAGGGAGASAHGEACQSQAFGQLQEVTVDSPIAKRQQTIKSSHKNSKSKAV